MQAASSRAVCDHGRRLFAVGAGNTETVSRTDEHRRGGSEGKRSDERSVSVAQRAGEYKFRRQRRGPRRFFGPGGRDRHRWFYRQRDVEVVGRFDRSDARDVETRADGNGGYKSGRSARETGFSKN